MVYYIMISLADSRRCRRQRRDTILNGRPVPFNVGRPASCNSCSNREEWRRSIEIADVLAPGEIQRLRHIAERAGFVDGRISNPHNRTKNNLQADEADARCREASPLARQALDRNETIGNFAFPKRIAPPLLFRERPGKS
jgi:hypothetical protein